MAAKQMLYDADARAAMLDGMAKLAAAVKVTLGPTGRNVLLQKSYGGPKVTKDGVTVSKEIELPNPFENMGAKMANQVASKTSDVAGDGTTTAVVLAEAIMREGLKNVTAGANPMAIKRGIDLAVEAAVGVDQGTGPQGQGQRRPPQGRHRLGQLGHRHRQAHRRGLREGRQRTA